MKYLKKFESGKNIMTRKEILDLEMSIKDILQDVIDKYDLEELPDDMEEDDDSNPGLYYHLHYLGHATTHSLVYFECGFHLVDPTIDFEYPDTELSLKFDDLYKDCRSEITETLESYGFHSRVSLSDSEVFFVMYITYQY